MVSQLSMIRQNTRDYGVECGRRYKYFILEAPRQGPGGRDTADEKIVTAGSVENSVNFADFELEKTKRFCSSP